MRIAMIDRGDERSRHGVIATALDPDCALCRSGQHFACVDRAADIRPPKPFEPSRGKQGRVDLARCKLGQPRIDIAAD